MTEDKEETTNEPIRPLQWCEARSKLVALLEDHLHQPPPPYSRRTSASSYLTRSSSRWWFWKRQQHRTTTDSISSTDGTTTTLPLWITYNLDFVLGVIPLSIALLAIPLVYCFLRRSTADSNCSDISRNQFIGAILVCLGSSCGMIILLRQRRQSERSGTNLAKKRAILNFLAGMKKVYDRVERRVDAVGNNTGDNTAGVAPQHQQEHGGMNMISSSMSSSLHYNNSTSTDSRSTELLTGSSLTDIYPVYRIQSSDGKEAWSKVPALLLVQGDILALQVGDYVPADCRLVGSNQTVLEKGDRLTTELLGSSSSDVINKFQRGKTTVPDNNPSDLLRLGNNMRIFIVTKAPLGDLLQCPKRRRKSPQVHRQIQNIRCVLCLMAMVVFMLSLGIALGRTGIDADQMKYVLHVPFLAAISLLPFVSSIHLFFVEVVGTSRILAGIHPYAAVRSDFIVISSGKAKRRPTSRRLLARYIHATIHARLSIETSTKRAAQLFRSVASRIFHLRDEFSNFDCLPTLIPVPHSSQCMLEKLGVATCFAVVDDELVCEPYSIPQQLLIPSGDGLKLLDLCPTYDEAETLSDEEQTARKQKKSFTSSIHESDSDSDDEGQQRKRQVISAKTLRRLRRRGRRRSSENADSSSSDVPTMDAIDEVQFEDPSWWQHLPALKCIGLACLFADREEQLQSRELSRYRRAANSLFRPSSSSLPSSPREQVQLGEARLLQHVMSTQRHRQHLDMVAKCIGFSKTENRNGTRGDMSLFTEVQRLEVVSTRILQDRLDIDSHALALEDSRNWGFLRTDSTSVIVQDKRSRAFQMLTVGDPRVVGLLCNEAWQGANSTILPFSAEDRRGVLETSNDWILSDLDVLAFGYTPLPQTFAQMLDENNPAAAVTKYLVSHEAKERDTGSHEWSLVNKQIFLGVLGSSVIPRKEIEKLLEVLGEAGVRFVYFSPRNMRRTKEIASLLGIDVAWNCAISLRPLEEGEDDAHRMTSEYADWDVNAKLPHGVNAVRKHLREVDNVPMLVSLYTDVCKRTTADMVDTFQEYHDTVITAGISHLSRNSEIFQSADLAIGIDVLESANVGAAGGVVGYNSDEFLLPMEVEFVTSMAAGSCAFRLKGATATRFMPRIIETARASLHAATNSVLFVFFGNLSFAGYAMFSLCSVSTRIPLVPMLGSVLFLQILLPILGLSLVMTGVDPNSMATVPPKNDESMTFGKKEGYRLYCTMLLRALPPAVFTQILHLIVFGDLMVAVEPAVLQASCGLSDDIDWLDVVRCDGLMAYNGCVLQTSGAMVLSMMVVSVVISSASFVHRTKSIWEDYSHPWIMNPTWRMACVASLLAVAVYLVVGLPRETISLVSWYVWVVGYGFIPLLSLACNEYVKIVERKHIRRSAMLRRLQFETKLGMWSPK